MGDDKSASKVIKQLKEILEIPVISEDSILKEKFLAIDPGDEGFVKLIEGILF